jgi:pyruvate/2-oxoglutarate dehydrogenase complex dihydrolipoamide acyltransferase (E2) component
MSKRVRATAKGYYGGMVRREGEAFDIKSDAAFSKEWMEWVEPAKSKEKPKTEPEPTAEAPKKYRLAPKSFKDDASEREVSIDQAIESAMTDAKLDVAGWNKLDEADRKGRIQQAARRLTQTSLA